MKEQLEELKRKQNVPRSQKAQVMKRSRKRTSSRSTVNLRDAYVLENPMARDETARAIDRMQRLKQQISQYPQPFHKPLRIIIRFEALIEPAAEEVIYEPTYEIGQQWTEKDAELLPSHKNGLEQPSLKGNYLGIEIALGSKCWLFTRATSFKVWPGHMSVWDFREGCDPDNDILPTSLSENRFNIEPFREGLDLVASHDQGYVFGFKCPFWDDAEKQIRQEYPKTSMFKNYEDIDKLLMDYRRRRLQSKPCLVIGLNTEENLISTVTGENWGVKPFMLKMRKPFGQEAEEKDEFWE